MVFGVFLMVFLMVLMIFLNRPCLECSWWLSIRGLGFMVL